MSYDLFFKASGKQPDRHDFEEYFDARPHYHIDDTAVGYENENTGVYFTFELSDSAGDADEFGPDEGELDTSVDDAADAYWVVFTMNYGKPNFFALEAATEVGAFIEHFNLSVADRENFSDADFLALWKAGNAAACGTMAAVKKGVTFTTLSADILEINWRWNLGVEKLREEIEEHLYVPTIAYVKQNGCVKSAVVWLDEIPICLPKVDLVIIGLKTSAPADDAENGDEELVACEWDRIVPFMSDFQCAQEPILHYKIAFEERPRKLFEFILSLPTCSDDMEGLGRDEVFDAELFK